LSQISIECWKRIIRNCHDHLPGRTLGKKKIGSDNRKQDVKLAKNPIHQAPTHAGLSGVRPLQKVKIEITY